MVWYSNCGKDGGGAYEKRGLLREGWRAFSRHYILKNHLMRVLIGIVMRNLVLPVNAESRSAQHMQGLTSGMDESHKWEIDRRSLDFVVRGGRQFFTLSSYPTRAR